MSRASESSGKPLVFVDVDDVLAVFPWDSASLDRLRRAGYGASKYSGPGPDGEHVESNVWLSPKHGQWLREISAAGADLVWATAWNAQAPAWVAPRLGLPGADEMPWVRVERTGVAFGRSLKSAAVREFAGGRPYAWLDNEFGGKDLRDARDPDPGSPPVLLVEVSPATGLVRADVDAVLLWLKALGQQQ